MQLVEYFHDPDNHHVRDGVRFGKFGINNLYVAFFSFVLEHLGHVPPPGQTAGIDHHQGVPIAGGRFQIIEEALKAGAVLVLSGLNNIRIFFDDDDALISR
ncbi:MAG: hypothetical protein IPM20_12630 [Gammaproteobacteria bacterium]|nr:hypothetical protein [Gammaproteobacteria bacterium]